MNPQDQFCRKLKSKIVGGKTEVKINIFKKLEEKNKFKVKKSWKWKKKNGSEKKVVKKSWNFKKKYEVK